MKRMTSSLMMAVTALTITAGAANAQSYRAEIPFAFSAGGKLMAPGIYQVKIETVHRLAIFSNFDAKQTVVAMSPSQDTPGKAMLAKGEPIVSFECGVGRCALTRLWSGAAEPVLTFPARGIGREEHALVTDIRLVRASD